MNKELISFCMQKGLLLDKDLLSVFSETSDVESVKVIIEKIRTKTQQRVITKNLIHENRDALGQCFSMLPMNVQKNLETLKIKLGLSIEISRSQKSQVVSTKKEGSVKVLSNYAIVDKKLEVKDFVNYFRNRFKSIRGFLQDHAELKDLVSLDKISRSRQNVCVIGIISDRTVTKNGNVMLEIEDLTGKAKVLINKNKEELFEKAYELTLDAVVGFKVSGSKEMLFANDIIFPDSCLPERKSAFLDESVLFIGDLHIGGHNFMEENFLKFIDYLNGKVPGTEEELKKIKYIFVVGDVIAGVGNYPNQENELVIMNLEEQFERAAELFSRIPKHIQIIISPGNHDAVRIMEPQPMFNEKFAWALYDLPNVTLTTNPSLVNVGSSPGFDGFNVLSYHGFSFFYYAENILPLLKQKAAHKPELVMQYLLKQRHLAPSHGSNQYFPGEIDCNLIKDIPDIFVSGHVHKSGITYYNNILLVSVSGWEKMTAYMEKRGAKPDFCKVPMFNLKTRAVKILDFE